MASSTDEEHVDRKERRPPVFSRWRGWYILVLSALVVYIILLYLFTNLF